MASAYGQITTDASGGVDTLIPDLVIPQIVASASAQEVLMPLVDRHDFTGPGANFALPSAPTMSFASYSADGSQTNETAFDTGSRTFTPAQRILDVVVALKAFRDSSVSISDAVAIEVASALADDRDTACLTDLYPEAPASSPDHEIGVDATILSFATLRSGQALLHGQKARKRFSWVVHTDQLAELLQDGTFIDASIKGSPVLTQGIGANGFATQVMDVDVYMSADVVESSGRHSIMFAPGAIGYGFKRLAPPGNDNAQEIMFDSYWNSKRRAYEINVTYEGHFEGQRDTATTNAWVVDIIS